MVTGGGENADKFETRVPLGYALALEPEGQELEGEQAPGDEPRQVQDEFPPVAADRVELQQRQDALRQEIEVIEGGRPPPGWRVDRFQLGEG